MGEAKRRILGFGPTGDYPRGMLNADDRGGIQIGIAVMDKTVIIKFGASVDWLGLGKEQALQLSRILAERAEEI